MQVLGIFTLEQDIGCSQLPLSEHPRGEDSYTLSWYPLELVAFFHNLEHLFVVTAALQIVKGSSGRRCLRAVVRFIELRKNFIRRSFDNATRDWQLRTSTGQVAVYITRCHTPFVDAPAKRVSGLSIILE